MTTVWVNGVESGQVMPFDRGLAYGDGLFATMRVKHHEILFLAAHLQRLSQGAKRLGFNWQASQTLQERLIQQAISIGQGCIKLLLTRGCGGRGYAAPIETQITEVVSVHPIPEHYQHWQQQGISLISSDVMLGRQPRLAGIKHCNRLEQIFIKSTPLPLGFDDYLVLDEQGLVIESSMANLFFVDNHQAIYTPALTHCGVAGMMREQVMHGVLTLGYSVNVTPISLNQLADFSAAFVTNSLMGVVDVIRINDMTMNKHPLTHTLRTALDLAL
ncbi:aminodeoxychorismate lyase [uncultured Shewanella sp.]|uniref:aminodeoxychorismate lyase n=1 Tax=uncultured Shewanella sp. TaxID=173975 RepID=UPI002618CE56|nr:aminodeoxychorismate lyase [uncultured Shewanella sp.]